MKTCQRFCVATFTIINFGNLAFVSQSALAFGSKKPKDAVLSPPSWSSRQLRKVVELDEFKAKQIFSNQNEGTNFENLIRLQYLSILIESGRYTVKIQNQSKRGHVQLASNGKLNVLYDKDWELNQLDLPENPVCTFPEEQLDLLGNVTSFELTSRSGVRFGFNPGAALWGIGAGFNYQLQKFSMGLNLQAVDPYHERLLAAADVSSVQTERTINFNFNYLQFAHFNYDSYSKTPMAQVSRNALVLGLNQMNARLDAMPWNGRVLVNERNEFVMLNIGFDAGLKVGDKLKVLNYSPSEDPSCRGGGWAEAPGKPNAPIAVVEVYDVSATTAWAEVTQTLGEGFIGPGSRVVADQLAP